MSAPLILLCAGGTGGHVFPARALAEELLKRGYRVAFACDYRGEKYLDGLKNVDIHVISAGPYRPGIKGKINFALSLIKGYAQTHALIGQLKPSVAVGFGGYPCAPPMFAAQHRGIPTVLHEQNAVLGLALKLLAPLATVIALSYPMKDSLKNGGSCRKETVVTGNPVRADIMALHDRPYPRIENEINILIFGGSLGAASFANVIPHSIIKLKNDLQLKLKVTHQARENDIGKVSKLYSDAGLDVEIKSFFDNIPQRLENTHLLICRSGASTVAEASCAGRPAIYVPYPWHKDQQQLHNARHVADAGGAWILEEKNLTAESLYGILKSVVPGKLAEAASQARTLGRPDAASALADVVVGVIRN